MGRRQSAGATSGSAPAAAARVRSRATRRDECPRAAGTRWWSVSRGCSARRWCGRCIRLERGATRAERADRGRRLPSTSRGSLREALEQLELDVYGVGLRGQHVVAAVAHEHREAPLCPWRRSALTDKPQKHAGMALSRSTSAGRSAGGGRQSIRGVQLGVALVLGQHLGSSALRSNRPEHQPVAQSNSAYFRWRSHRARRSGGATTARWGLRA